MDPQSPAPEFQPEKPVVPSSAPKRTMFMLVAMIVALLATTSYLAFQNYQLKKQIAVVDNPSPSPLVTSTPDPTADWETYTSSDYSFKYPADYFKYKEETTPGYVYLAPSKGKGGNGIKFLESTDVWLDASNQTPMDFDPETVTTPVTIGGLTGKKLTLSSPMVAGNVTKYSYVAWVNANGKLYSMAISSWNEISLKSSEKLFDQILSTFKFTN